jgi:hypothetical protein
LGHHLGRYLATKNYRATITRQNRKRDREHERLSAKTSIPLKSSTHKKGKRNIEAKQHPVWRGWNSTIANKETPYSKRSKKRTGQKYLLAGFPW